MRELINCIAATAAWLEFCTANRLVDCPELRRSHQGQLALVGPAYLIARCMAITIELAVLEQARREMPRVIRLNGRA